MTCCVAYNYYECIYLSCFERSRSTLQRSKCDMKSLWKWQLICWDSFSSLIQIKYDSRLCTAIVHQMHLTNVRKWNDSFRWITVLYIWREKKREEKNRKNTWSLWRISLINVVLLDFSVRKFNLVSNTFVWATMMGHFISLALLKC